MENPKEHVIEFFKTFVRERECNRWLYLFEKNSEKLRNKSSSLLEDIDARFLLEDKHLKTIPNHDIEGFFYEIGGKEPCMANLADILKKQPHFIAIFSIEAGKFVIFHNEGQRYVLSA